MLKGNKGEWSEVYTLLRILSDKAIFVGDENLNKVPGLLYPIVRVLRDEKCGSFEYSIDDELIVIRENNDEFSIPIIKFKEQANLLLSEIKNVHSGSFEIPRIEAFLNEIKCSSVKAKATSKTDIRVVIHDLKTNLQPELGFSIKSQLGSPSTLLNAGRTTNFIYQIDSDLSGDAIAEINSIDSRQKIKDRLNRLFQLKAKIKFQSTEKEIFGNNLVLIDSFLPDILAYLLILFFTTNKSDVKALVEELELINPMGYNIANRHRFYEYKVKKFLTEVALGMMPSIVWSGLYDVTGGYLVVKDDGDILSYHMYNKNKFEDYLYNNTKFETASSSRHAFGEIYANDDKNYINLNLQIRFKK